MKKILLLVTTFLAFSTAVLADFTIEVCKVPIDRLIGTEIPGISHVFVRGTFKGIKTALNFGPATLNASEIASGKAVVANVTHEDYQDATCETVLYTEDELTYATHWSAVHAYYESAKKKTDYQVYNVHGKNCGQIAKKACEAANLLFPFENINGQDHTANLLFGLGDIKRNGANAENLSKVIGSGLGTLGGVVKETDGGDVAGNILNTVGTMMHDNSNQNCIVQ